MSVSDGPKRADVGHRVFASSFGAVPRSRSLFHYGAQNRTNIPGQPTAFVHIGAGSAIVLYASDRSFPSPSWSVPQSQGACCVLVRTFDSPECHAISDANDTGDWCDSLSSIAHKRSMLAHRMKRPWRKKPSMSIDVGFRSPRPHGSRPGSRQPPSDASSCNPPHPQNPSAPHPINVVSRSGSPSQRPLRLPSRLDRLRSSGSLSRDDGRRRCSSECSGRVEVGFNFIESDRSTGRERHRPLPRRALRYCAVDSEPACHPCASAVYSCCPRLVEVVVHRGCSRALSSRVVVVVEYHPRLLLDNGHA